KTKAMRTMPMRMPRLTILRPKSGATLPGSIVEADHLLAGDDVVAIHDGAPGDAAAAHGNTPPSLVIAGAGLDKAGDKADPHAPPQFLLRQAKSSGQKLRLDIEIAARAA